MMRRLRIWWWRGTLRTHQKQLAYMQDWLDKYATHPLTRRGDIAFCQHWARVSLDVIDEAERKLAVL